MNKFFIINVLDNYTKHPWGGMCQNSTHTYSRMITYSDTYIPRWFIIYTFNLGHLLIIPSNPFKLKNSQTLERKLKMYEINCLAVCIFVFLRQYNQKT